MKLSHCIAGVAIALLVAPAAAVAQSRADVPGAAAVAAAAQRHGRVRVIARLKDVRAVPEVSAAMQGLGVAKVEQLGRRPLVVLEMNAAQLERLLQTGQVEAVQEDVPIPPSLAQSGPLIQAPQARAAGAGGAGWAVAILDSGVQTSHPFLAGRTAAEACFSTNSSFWSSASVCPNGTDKQIGTGAGVNCPADIDGCDHGTHVSGIAAGRNYSGGPGYNSVAPDAQIIAIQVFSRFEGAECTRWGKQSPCALTLLSDQIKGLEHVASLARAGSLKVAAVNMSLGGSVQPSACDSDLRKPSIDDLRTLGIATVIASGNNSSNDGVSEPGCISSAVTVGATTDYTTPEVVASFSNSAAMVDLLAPGEWIDSSVPGNSFAAFRGTSMAAPHVAGAFAALRSKVPDKSVGEIQQALESTGKAITDADNNITKPRLDPYKALAPLGVGPSWHAWASRGGSLGGAPECQQTGSEIACWVRTAAGALAWNRSADGNTWSGWVDLRGSLGGFPECLVRGSRIDCFAVTTVGQLAQITYNGSSWGAWINLGGALAARPPSCVPASSGFGLDCFANGKNAALWRRQFDGTAWKTWQSVGGSSTKPPECVRRGSAIECFIVDGSGNLKSRRLSGGTWGSWRQVGAGFARAPHCLVASGKMDCLAQGSGNRLLHGFYNGTSWSAWANLAGDVTTRPYCNRLSTGLDCYAVSSTFQLVRRQRTGTTTSSWLPWENLGGSVQQQPTCLARNGGARIDCLALGRDNTMQQGSYY